MAALPSYPQQTALPPPSRIVIADPPERDCSDYCCACDGGYEWYELKGKGKNTYYKENNNNNNNKNKTKNLRL